MNAFAEKISPGARTATHFVKNQPRKSTFWANFQVSTFWELTQFCSFLSIDANWASSNIENISPDIQNVSPTIENISLNIQNISPEPQNISPNIKIEA